MERDKLDFTTMKIGPLFKAMFFPTLVGMIFNSLLTVIDGMFVGKKTQSLSNSRSTEI